VPPSVVVPLELPLEPPLDDPPLELALPLELPLLPPASEVPPPLELLLEQPTPVPTATPRATKQIPVSKFFVILFTLVRRRRKPATRKTLASGLPARMRQPPSNPLDLGHTIVPGRRASGAISRPARDDGSAR
jgi:hypothetical protein